MLQKFVFIPYTGVEKMSNDFNAEEGFICGANIKELHTTEKTIKQKSGMLVRRNMTTWGVFIHIRMKNGNQYDAVWKLGKSFTEGAFGVPLMKVPKRKSKKDVISATIPTVLRAIGVSEWVNIIGTVVRVKPVDGVHPAVNGFGISPIDENFGGWFYPDYFEIHEGGVAHE